MYQIGEVHALSCMVWCKPALGFNRDKREGDDVEAIDRLFNPEFRKILFN